MGPRRNRALTGALAAALTGCVVAGDDMPTARSEVVDLEAKAQAGTFTPDSTLPSSTSEPTPPPPPPPTVDGVPAIDAAAPGSPIDRRVLGTNLPAWLGPAAVADPAFREAAIASGTTLIRMPGGSWSNLYDWSGCERGDPDRCIWTWATRPRDFAAFLHATGLPGMWTVSPNETAQSAGALVAYFNGDVGDTTVIGVDRNGVDWGTVDDWARLRSGNGNPDPVDIDLWEIGNEVFGGSSAAGGRNCAPFGWERVWTCDGTEYVEGTEDHDGALDLRAAMLAVDPTIEVGLVGTAHPSDWNDWGAEVIEAAGAELDFYVVHHYGFARSPVGADAVRRPAETWPWLIDSVERWLPDGVPMAITEYSLVSIEEFDTEHTLTTAMNAFFVADSIGQLIVGNVTIANQWNLANGTTTSGTDYGLIDLADGSRFPAFEALALWSRTGTTLLDQPAPLDDDLRVYPTRHDDGRLSIVVLNLGESEAVHTLALSGLTEPERQLVTIESLVTEDLSSTTLSAVPAEALGPPVEPIDVRLPPLSISLVEVVPAA